MHAVKHSAELARILALPRHDPSPADLETLVDQFTAALKTPTGTQRLRPLQALALYYILTQGGAFVPLDVGFGKTLVSLLAIAVAGVPWGVLILPANLIPKTERERDEVYGPHWRIPTSLSLVSYQAMSREGQADYLEEHQPPLIILDEAHYAKAKSSAVTRRIARYMAKHPDTRFVAMTGTPMRDSLRNVHHLMAWSLKDLSPLPMTLEINDWAGAVDERPDGAKGDDTETSRVGLGALATFGADLPAVRQGLRAHIIATPGVVATSAADEPVPYRTLVRHIHYRPSFETRAHIARLKDTGKTPDDWDVAGQADKWRHTRELAAGFHSIWDPRPEPEWTDARRNWFAFVRTVLARSKTWDTTEQVERAVDSGKVQDPKGLLATWRRIAPTFVPNPIPVWHDTTCSDLVADWALTKPGIVWVEHVPFAERLALNTGLAYYRQKGLAADGSAIEADPGTRSIIASVKANKEGRNLQAKWCRNLVVAPREGPDEWHQLIGRTARTGQIRDVEVDVMFGCREHHTAWSRAMSGAQALRDTTGQPNRLLTAEIIE